MAVAAGMAAELAAVNSPALADMSNPTGIKTVSI